MTEFVYGHDAEIAKFYDLFAHGQIASPHFGHCKTIGVIDKEGKLVAGLIYYNYNKNSAAIELGVASITPRWLNRAVYRRMFEYPFIECGCQMLYVRIRADNERLLSVVARMNFDLIYVPRMFGRNDDGVYCTLTDDQWLDSNVSKRLYRDARKKNDEEAA